MALWLVVCVDHTAWYRELGNFVLSPTRLPPLQAQRLPSLRVRISTNYFWKAREKIEVKDKYRRKENICISYFGKEWLIKNKKMDF